MRNILRKMMLRWLGLTYQKPEVFVVLDTTNQVDSVWFNLQNAEEHVSSRNKSLELLEMDLRLLKPRIRLHGNFILDAQEGVYRP